MAEAVLQMLMESDVEGQIGAGRYERTGERASWRNGYRDRTLDTRLGTLQLRIPKLRQGTYFPPFLEARKTSERALMAVIQEAWIGGVSTRRWTSWRAGDGDIGDLGAGRVEDGRSGLGRKASPCRGRGGDSFRLRCREAVWLGGHRAGRLR